jgi:hypothetical protein
MLQCHGRFSVAEILKDLRASRRQSSRRPAVLDCPAAHGRSRIGCRPTVLRRESLDPDEPRIRGTAPKRRSDTDFGPPLEIAEEFALPPELTVEVLVLALAQEHKAEVDVYLADYQAELDRHYAAYSAMPVFPAIPYSLERTLASFACPLLCRAPVRPDAAAIGPDGTGFRATTRARNISRPGVTT